jgi:guanylate kinase
VGKGTVVQRVLREHPDVHLSVSVTTRPPRPGEREGVEYFFVDPSRFDELVASHDLLEWAEIYGHRSGTPAEPIREARARGRDVLLEIDVQGAGWVRRRIPEAVLIFLRPPSLEELERRLRARGTESEEVLRRRLDKAEAEMAEASWFHHVVVNDDVDEAASQVAAILRSVPPRDDIPTAKDVP